MAELKPMEDFDLEVPISPVKHPDEQQSQPKLVPVFPQKKIRKISRIEKLSVFFLLAAFIAVSVLTVYVSTSITQQTEEITVLQQKIANKNKNIEKFEQEKSELSQKDRLKKIAEKAGLQLRDENIRNVTK